VQGFLAFYNSLGAWPVANISFSTSLALFSLMVRPVTRSTSSTDHSGNRQVLEVEPQFIDVAQEFAADPIIDGFGRLLDWATAFSK